MNEAEIEINGNLLSIGQSMTIRVALESFAQYLAENGLGNDNHGKRMVNSYAERICEIRQFLYGEDNDY